MMNGRESAHKIPILLQYAAATIDDVNKFVIHFMFRYRISSWADPNFEGEKISVSGYRLLQTAS